MAKGTAFRPYPSICGKKITADFDGGPIISNGGAMPLAAADRRLGDSTTLARTVRDRRT